MNRRISDKSFVEQLKHSLADGDISMTLLLGGLGLILWAFFGMWNATADLAAYITMFPFGGAQFWIMNYITCAAAMWALVGLQYPPLMSLLVGGWVTTIWSWSLFARTTQMATLQTGNATSVIYIILGILIIQRSARR